MSGPQILRTVPRVVVIDSPKAPPPALGNTLRSFGYQVAEVSQAAELEPTIEQMNPDLVVMELMLRDVDGLVLCSQIAQSGVPVIVCSGTRRHRDSILALRLGVDDFVHRPYDPYEFRTRIEAVIKRRRAVDDGRPAGTGAADEIYRINDLTVDVPRRNVTLGQTPLHLTPTEYRLLTALASSPSIVLSRDQLSQAVWGYSDPSCRRTIDVHIRRLRAKLQSGPVAPPPIVSVRGFGYKITPDVHAVDEAEAS
jgi:DNA-binding response OmpR family regulator